MTEGCERRFLLACFEKNEKNTFQILIYMLYYPSFGALAQLGARHTGSVEATGSSPVCSRKETLYERKACIRFFYFFG